MVKKLKKKKKLKIKTIIKIIIFFLILISLLYIFFSFTIRKISNLNIFKIKEISCVLPKHIQKSDVISDNSIISKGKSIFSFSIREAKQEILRNPWIKNVRIRRNLPSKLEIVIKEKIPVALIKQKDKLYYIDRKGGIIGKIIPGYKNNLPIIKSKPQDYIKGIYVISKIQNSEKIKNIPLKIISELHIDSSDTVIIYPVKEKIKYKIRINNIEEGIINAQKVMSNLKLRNEKAYSIDASLPENKVVVKLVI